MTMGKGNADFERLGLPQALAGVEVVRSLPKLVVKVQSGGNIAHERAAVRWGRECMAEARSADVLPASGAPSGRSRRKGLRKRVGGGFAGERSGA